MNHSLPYESQSAPDLYPPDNNFTLLRTLAKCGTLLTVIGVAVHFFLPLRESFIKTQNQDLPVCVGYDSPLKTHLKGIKNGTN